MSENEMSEQPSGVRIRGLRKRYGDTLALDGLDLDARPGEIVGVAGPNGAGKSTMVKVLAGEIGWDEGEILVDGAPWSSEYGSNRVAVVHQEPQLFPNLTVAQNVLAGHEGSGWRWPRSRQAHNDLFAELGIDETVRDTPLGELGIAVQQRTEIVRALVRDARVMLFDEPNSALTPDESAEFFRLTRQLAGAGHVILLISHRLTELAAIADRIVVIVDGRSVRVLEGSERTAENIAETLVRGSAARSQPPAGAPLSGRSAPQADAGLELVGFTDRARVRAFADLNVAIPKGCVTALVGVEGSGAREIVRACGGLRRVQGHLRVEGRPIAPGRIGELVSYVAADRAAGLFSNLSVGENLVIRLDSEISRGGLALRRSRMHAIAEELRTEFQIKAADVELGIRSLSGGNQQKVAIAAAVRRRPRVLALEEPTRGVDHSSKAEIYEILQRFAADGGTVLLFCTEIPEVHEVADRLHVVSGGKLSAPLEVADFANMEALAKAVAGLETHASHAAAA
jgi:ABC-type sugar transport system ATPase subunit